MPAAGVLDGRTAPGGQGRERRTGDPADRASGNGTSRRNYEHYCQILTIRTSEQLVMWCPKINYDSVDSGSEETEETAAESGIEDVAPPPTSSSRGSGGASSSSEA